MMALPVKSLQRPGVRLLLDTAFCLHLIRERPASVLRALASYRPGEVAVSALTVAALQARAERSRDPERNQRALEQFLLPLVVADFDSAAAARLGQVSVAAGSGDHARLLAAHALQLNATLITVEPGLYGPTAGLRVNGPGVSAWVGPAIPANKQLPARPQGLLPLPGAIVAAGSHDLSLELLGDYVHVHHPAITLISAHVGSLDGLLALQRGEAHLAGSHLLDTETGEYNRSYVERLLAAHGRRVVLLGFVGRVQGLIVGHGNPKEITALEDLLRPDVRFVNRQPGAGTRVLLDYELKRRGLDSSRISGYGQEEASHAAVAAAVAGGEADCGLGIQAIAHTHDLDFVPLFSERYDLVIPADCYESELLAPLLEVVRKPSGDFLRRVRALGGYETAMMGQVLWEG